jgi:hypothetical protein
LSDPSSNTLVWSGLSSFSEFGGGGQGGALPVELTFLQAACHDDGFVLNWATASENNSSHFEVEKSENGTDWSVIGSVQAAGNSTQDIHYSFIDSEKSFSNKYYRLNQVDIDGKNEFYGPVQVNCESDEFITSYPNPSKNEFNVLVKSKSIGTATMKIIDASGSIVACNEIQLNDGINLFAIHEKLNSGIFNIQILTDTGKLLSTRHIVN